MLVKQGRLKWDTTVGKVFPDMLAGLYRDVRNITILQLLSHNSGLPDNPNLVVYGGLVGRRSGCALCATCLAKRYDTIWAHITNTRTSDGIVCINQSGDTAFQASDEAISALIKLHSRILVAFGID